MSRKASKRLNAEVATPSNAITVLRILLVPVFVAALLTPWSDWLGAAASFSDDWKSIIAATIFVIISGTDWLDGYLARSRNEITDFGKFMDPLADKILVASALICLVELGDLPTWVVLIILAREFIVSGVRMMAASKGVVIAASMVGKFKTVFQMIAIVLFTLKRSHLVDQLGPGMGSLLWYVSWTFMLVALALTIASMIDYLSKSRDIIGLGKSSFDPVSDDGYADDALGLRDRASLQAQRVVERAKQKGATIATAESLTGGMLGAAITSVPGSSAVYRGGIVSYVNDVKHSVLLVSEGDLKEHGAVSQPVAEQMSKGALTQIGSTISVAVTGLAGPTGDEYGNPVGTVYIAVNGDLGAKSYRKVFSGNRHEIRLKTVIFALEALYQYLGELS